MKADRAVLFILLFLMGLSGAGLAFAKAPYVGQTYAKAVAKIESRNGTAVIRTVIGDQLAIDDCLVTNAQKSRTAKRTWLLDLNCVNRVAAPGEPGNSVATPEGRAARDRQLRADNWDQQVSDYLAGGKKVPWCGRNPDHTATCKQFCARYGVCSTQLADYLDEL